MTQSIIPPENIWSDTNVGRLLCSVSNDYETDLGMGVIPFLVACSTVTQGKFSVCIPRSYGEHQEPLCIFGITIAEASERKSAIHDLFMEPIWNIEEDLNQNEEYVRNLNIKNANAKARLRVLRNKYAYAPENGEDIESLEQSIAEVEASIQDIPHPLKLAVQDVRATAFAREIERQPGTRLTIADGEGGSIEPILKERQLMNFMVDGFNGGKASYLRETKPSIDIKKAYISLSIMMQPEKLKRLTGKRQLWYEGIMARVLPVFIWNRAGLRLGQQILSDTEILSWYRKKIRILHDYPWQKDSHGDIIPYVLRFENESFACWDQWRRDLECRQAPYNATHIYKAWYGKMAGVTARIAALIHLMEINNPTAYSINLKHMQVAISIVKIIEPHMQKLYSILCPNPIETSAFHLARWIITTQGSQIFFSLSEAIKNTKLTSCDAHLAARYLVTYGVLSESIPQPFFGKQQGLYFNINWERIYNFISSYKDTNV